VPQDRASQTRRPTTFFVGAENPASIERLIAYIVDYGL
jgi:hypothetical protein